MVTALRRPRRSPRPTLPAADLSVGIFAPDYREGTLFAAQGVLWQRKRYANGALRGAETLDGRYRAVEQNQQKPSEWSDLARAGHQVLWIFDNQRRGSQYAARVVDGELVVL